MLAMSVSPIISMQENKPRSGFGKTILTAAEFAGTTFPEEVIIQPLGIPADDV